MPKKMIELEIRGIVKTAEIPDIASRLLRHGFRPHTTTNRTMVMSFGEVAAKGKHWSRKMIKGEVDIRCRVTNGSAEVVAKIGEPHAVNRKEISILTSVTDMVKFAQLFGSMSFYTKVGSRHTRNFKKGPLTFSIVQSPSGLAYFELEKMSDPTQEKNDLHTLHEWVKRLELTPIPNAGVFHAFCDELDRCDDWTFDGSEEATKRLKQEIRRARSGQTTGSRHS